MSASAQTVVAARVAEAAAPYGAPELKKNLKAFTQKALIIAVILPDQDRAVRLWQALLEGGLYVNLARPPATPSGMYLLRCSLCAEHSDDQVSQILAIFETAGKAVGVI